MAAPAKVGEDDTLMEALKRYEREGFKGHFAARPGSRLMCMSCREESPARLVRLRALHRLEGTSDPSDEVGVAALVCPRCETRGTLVVHYGPEASPEESLVLRDLRDDRDASSIRSGV